MLFGLIRNFINSNMPANSDEKHQNKKRAC